MKSIFLQFLTVSFIFYFIDRSTSHAVCDERLLMMELKQDIEDNGVLDCLRVIQPPHSYDETIEERNKRIAAQWDSACAFEADYDWMKPLREIHGISNLVDDTGDIVDKDFEDQADMCEIIRASIASGKFNKITSELTNIPERILDLIDCPGSPEQSEICAVTGSSYFQNDTWYILLDGMGLNVDGKPHFVIAPNVATMPDIPEVQKTLLKGLQDAGGAEGLGNLKGNKLKQKLASAWDKIKGMVSNMNTGDGKSQSIIVPNSEKILIFESELNSLAKTDSSNKFQPFGNTIAKPVVTEERVMVVFADSTVNFEQKAPSHFVAKLFLDGTEQKDTRQLEGNFIQDSINTGFVCKISKGDHKVHMEYRSPGVLTGTKNDPENIWQDNRYVGAMVLNGNLKFYRNAKPINTDIKKTSVWTSLDVLKTKFSVDTDRPALFFYNIATEVASVLGARLSVDGNDIKSTFKKVSAGPFAGVFGVGVKILTQGDHEITVEYISGATGKIDFNTDWQSAGVSVVELPVLSVIHEKALETEYTLIAMDWNLLGNLKYDLNIDREKNCLVYYTATFDMKAGVNNVYMRVVDNGKAITKSRAASSNGDVAGISNQFLLNLKPGKHALQLQYYTIEKNWKIDPNNGFQAATFNIIEFEAEAV